MRVISSGVDLARFAPREAVDRAVLCARYKLAGEGPLMLYVGRVQADKSLDVLLRALALAAKPGGHQLIVAGRGDCLPALQKLARRLGLTQRVAFPGYVPSTELPDLLASIDLFTMPSTVELESIATLEAMASGRPVLAANARALPELVSEGVNGLLFAPGDEADAARQMLSFMRQPERWPAMGAASRSIALGRGSAETYAQYEQLYREVSGTSRTA